MRGKVVDGDEITICTGITPAYAGKSYEIDALAKSIQDHPRLCGEKVKICLFGNNPSGSPPPMRGKGWQVYFKFPCIGITPAYAGKSGTKSISNSS